MPHSFSLLSRGIGAKIHTKSGHDRLDVVFEPQDWLTVGGVGARVPPRTTDGGVGIHRGTLQPLPPIGRQSPQQSKQPGDEIEDANHTPKPMYPTLSQSWNVTDSSVKKTYSTRKGALLLYSEEFADRYGVEPLATEDYSVHQTKTVATVAAAPKAEEPSKQIAAKEKTEEDLKTCGDLYRSILSFGKTDDDEYEFNLKIKPERHRKDEREIRPGFSAKRYINTFSVTWDPSVFEKLRFDGKLTDKTLFGSYVKEPTSEKRIHFDMSNAPLKYELRGNILADMRPHKFNFTWKMSPKSDTHKSITEDDIEVEDLEKDKTEVTDRSEAKRKSIVRTISAKRRKTPTQEIGDRKEDGGTVDASSKPTRDDYEEIDYKQMPIEEKVEMLTDIMMQAAEEFEKQMSPKSVSEQLEDAEREAMAKEAAEKEAATREKQAEPSAEISDDLKPSEHEKPPAEDDISKPLETEQTEEPKAEIQKGPADEEADESKSDIASVDEAATEAAPIPPEGTQDSIEGSLFDFKTKTEFDVAMEAVIDRDTKALEEDVEAGKETLEDMEEEKAAEVPREPPTGDELASKAIPGELAEPVEKTSEPTVEDKKEETVAPAEGEAEKVEAKKPARKPSPSEVHPMGRPSIGDDLDEQRSHVSSRESSRSLRGNKLKAVITNEEPASVSPRDQQPDHKLADMVVSGSQPSSRKGDRKTAAKEDDATAERVIREVSQANETTEGAESPTRHEEDDNLKSVDEKSRVSSGASSVSQGFPAYPVLPPIGQVTDVEKSDDFAKLEEAVAKAKENEDTKPGEVPEEPKEVKAASEKDDAASGVASQTTETSFLEQQQKKPDEEAKKGEKKAESVEKKSKSLSSSSKKSQQKKGPQTKKPPSAITSASSVQETASSVQSEDEDWGGATVDETKVLKTLVAEEKKKEEALKLEKERLEKERKAEEKKRQEEDKLAKEAKKAEEKRLAEEAEEKAEAERKAKEEAAKEAILQKRSKAEKDRAVSQPKEEKEPSTAGPAVGNKTVDMFGSLPGMPQTTTEAAAAVHSGLKAAKKVKQRPKVQMGAKNKSVFQDAAGEKGAFVKFKDELLNVGHELEMKERLIENMKNLFSSLLAQNLLKKLRGKKGLYRRATLVAAAVLSQLFGGADLGMDAKVAARLWGTKLADLMGDDGEMEYYIDPETGELKQRRKRKEIPKLEVFVDKDGKMYVITESGERIEVFKDPKTGKLMFRTKSGKLIEVPGSLDLYTDPITGKMYLGEKKDPGMEVFTDPITGKMFIKTKDGKIMEIITDPKTGKVYMRTASGNLKELPPGMELYVDPTTGKMYIGTKPKDEAQYEIFTDPITGKQYIRTEDGELLEIVVGEDGKTYLKTKSGKLRALPDDMQIFTDPVTGKMFIGKTGAAGTGGGGESFEVFTDPVTGKQFIRTKDGEILEIYTDPVTGKVFLKTKSGKLRELPADMELVTDPVTGKVFLKQNKDPGLQIFTDPLTGKMYVKTKDGEIMEVVIGEDGKTYLRTKSGTLKELGDHLEMYVDPITGKMYLGERRNPGMEVFVDPETGITYVRTADGQILEMWTDPNTGKVYLRTKSGKIVSEVDENMVMYTDPKTGKMYLAPKAGAQQSGVFTDPNTGITYIRTKSGRIVEAAMDEEMEIYVDPVTGKTYLRTKSGTLKEMPMDAEIIKDPLTGKVYMKTKSGRLMEIKGDVDVFVDPKTGKTYVMQKGAEGDITVLTDPATGKMYLRTACGELQELVSDGSVFIDPTTGKSYVRTKSGRLHELSDDCEIFVDPETGKLFMRTKSGNILEMGDDVTMFTDPRTGKTYVKTISGRFIELDEDMEVTIDPVTGKMFIRTKSGTLKELACEMETIIDPITGKKIVRPKGGVGLGFELYVDPETGKAYLRPRDDLLDEIDLDQLTPAERRRIEVLKKRRQKEMERKQQEEEERREAEAKLRAEIDRQIMEDKIREAEEAKRIEEEEARKAEEEAKRDPIIQALARLRAEEEERKRREEEEKMANLARIEREKYEQLEREQLEWERLRKEEEERLEREKMQMILEESRRMAIEMKRKQAELEAKALFNKSLRMEQNILEKNQEISRAFVYSYFELMKMLEDLGEGEEDEE